MTTPEKIILYIFAFIAFCYIMDMINNISRYFKEKKNYQFMINKSENTQKTKIDMPDRIKSTLDIIDLANMLIDREIGKTMQSCVMLRSKYDVTHLDKDVTIISNTVFESLKPEVFVSDDLVITDTFLMQHINDEVMMRLLKAGREFNNALKEM